MQHNKFATGRKVYATGSYAPSTGANKKKGYIAREFRRRNKKRMKAAKVSQAVAQGALRYKVKGLK
jgi:hypothetical protein